MLGLFKFKFKAPFSINVWKGIISLFIVNIAISIACYEHNVMYYVFVRSFRDKNPQ